MTTWLDAVWADLRSAWRALLHSRRYTGWVIGSLAIGMAVTIAALALLNAVMLSPFPGVTDQSRLVRVNVTRNCGNPDCWSRMSSPSDYAVLQQGLKGLQGRVTIGGFAGGNLFDAVGLRLVAGRTFTEAEQQQSRPQVAVVNQTFAARMNGPAIGSVLRVALRDHDFASAIDVRVVGIIEPAVEPRYEEGLPAAKVYLPASLEPEPALTLYVRTHGAAAALAQPLREVVGQIAPRVPILDIGSLDEFNQRSFGQQLWLARGAAFLGVVGLLLATAGLYGVASYVVAMRSRELAIRMALGARPQVILTMILGQSMRIALAGLIVGAASAAVASRVIQAGYYGIRGIDAMAFGRAMALFVVAMLVASTIPAVRASRVDPVQNLKDA